MGWMDKMKDAAAQATQNIAEKVVDTTSQAVADAKQNVGKLSRDIAAERSDAGVPAPGGPRPLYEVVSHIEGKNAKVRLYADRIEWVRERGVSAAKLTAGAMTVGASFLVTGVKGGKDAYDMVLLKHVTNVSNRKDGVLYHLVEIQTASGGAVNTVAFRVSRDEAAQFRGAILDARQALENQTHAAVVVQQPTPVAPSPVIPDLASQLQQLAGLRDAGILTEEEFAAKKAEILARF